VNTKWPVVPLHEICRPTQWPTISQEELTAWGFPVYGANGVIGRYPSYNHEFPTVLITCRGATCGTINVSEPKSYVTGNAMALDALDQKRTDTRYLFHVLRQTNMAQAISGSAQPQITRGSLNVIAVPLPPIEEQRRIAAILDKADELRAKRRAALAHLSSLTQSIFLDMFGDPSHVQDGSSVAMSSVFREPPVFGTMVPASRVRRSHLTLRVANIQAGALTLTDRKYVDLADRDLRRHGVEKGDLLMARAIGSLDHLGKCIVANPDGDQWAFDSHLMRLRLDSKRMLPEFFRAWLLTPGGRAAFLACTRRSAVQFNVNTKEIARLRLRVPAIEDQELFVGRCAAIGSQTAVHATGDLQLDELFASLQQRAFAGL
jgi:type I restriction enzyme, S subunit